MARFGLSPWLLAAGCLLSGLYGAAHDQLSYTVSPDYFHHRKFRQFDLPPHQHNRLGAALVGWHATWWMGLYIGTPLLAVALIIPDPVAYFTRSLKAFGVVALTALVFGLWGLASACVWPPGPVVHPWPYPEGVTDEAGYDRARLMHEHSYLGGFVGILTGSAYLVVARVRMSRQAPGK